jgi:hypothetical protein
LSTLELTRGVEKCFILFYCATIIEIYQINMFRLVRYCILTINLYRQS